MESSDKNQSIELIRKGTWILIAASIFSCLSRNDYNIIGAMSVLIIIGLFYTKFPKLITKISVHIYVGLCILDLIWLIIMMFVWTHGEGSSTFWKSLSFMHNLIYWFGVLELIGKGYLLFLLFGEFKKYGNQNELFNFIYNV